MKRATFSILFFAKKNKPLRDGTYPLYVRITINGQSKETALGQSVAPELWNPSSQRAIGRSKVAEEINETISEAEADIRLKRRTVADSEQHVTSDALMSAYKGPDEKRWTILSLFQEHQDRFLELVNNGHHSIRTHKRYKTTISHIEEFIKKEYQCSDLDCNKIDLAFVNGFEHFLKVNKDCTHNSAMKHVKGLRKVVLQAVNQDIIRKDPFNHYKIRTEYVEKEFLTQSELDILYSKEISNKRLATIRDMFIFQCYTGMAYCDIEALAKNHIVKGEDEMFWIIKKREKTGQTFRIPLLPRAEEILFKYADDFGPQNQGILPVSSNQKMKAYLKEIAIICGVNKNLTTHLGRHTFATTITLNNDISKPVLQSMMGVTKTSTLDIYAKMLDSTISREMRGLRKLD
jgi:site-specific recombinase XerD